MFNTELRRAIPSHPDYEASSKGHIYRKGSSKPLIGDPNAKGYLRVTLNDTRYTIHKLILETFVCPRPGRLQGRHLNDNKLDNRLDNLRWGTQEDNVRDFHRIHKRHHNSKLLFTDIRKIKELLQTGNFKQTLIAEVFGVSPTCIHNISTCKTYATV